MPSPPSLSPRDYRSPACSGVKPLGPRLQLQGAYTRSIFCSKCFSDLVFFSSVLHRRLHLRPCPHPRRRMPTLPRRHLGGMYRYRDAHMFSWKIESELPGRAVPFHIHQIQSSQESSRTTKTRPKPTKTRWRSRYAAGRSPPTPPPSAAASAAVRCALDPIQRRRRWRRRCCALRWWGGRGSGGAAGTRPLRGGFCVGARYRPQTEVAAGSCPAPCRARIAL